MKRDCSVFLIGLALWSFPGTPQAWTEESISRFPVVVNEKWGYIDQAGTIVIEPQFDWVGQFSEGLAPVRVGDSTTRRWGYINDVGEVVISPQFRMAGEFSEGLAEVGAMSGRTGYIDSTGKMIIEPQFHFTHPFSEGLAVVGAGFIDKTGKLVIKLPPRSLDDSSDFSEGLAGVMLDQERGRYGYIDRTGAIVIKPQFNDAGRFFEGLATANVTFAGGYATVRCDFIDKTGKIVLKRRFCDWGSSKNFSRDLQVEVGANGKFGYIDKTGEFAIYPQFNNALPFSEGLAAVFIGDEDSRPNERLSGEWGFINKAGKFVIEPQFPAEAMNMVSVGFSNGLFKIAIGETREETWDGLRVNIARWGYIDKTGRLVWEGEQIWRFRRHGSSGDTVLNSQVDSKR